MADDYSTGIDIDPTTGQPLDSTNLNTNPVTRPRPVPVPTPGSIGSTVPQAPNYDLSKSVQPLRRAANSIPAPQPFNAGPSGVNPAPGPIATPGPNGFASGAGVPLTPNATPPFGGGGMGSTVADWWRRNTAPNQPTQLYGPNAGPAAPVAQVPPGAGAPPPGAGAPPPGGMPWAGNRPVQLNQQQGMPFPQQGPGAGSPMPNAPTPAAQPIRGPLAGPGPMPAPPGGPPPVAAGGAPAPAMGGAPAPAAGGQPQSPFTMIMRPNAPAESGGRGGGGPGLTTALDLSGWRPPAPVAQPAARPLPTGPAPVAARPAAVSPRARAQALPPGPMDPSIIARQKIGSQMTPTGQMVGYGRVTQGDLNKVGTENVMGP